MDRLLNDEELMAIIKRNGNRGWSIQGSDRIMVKNQDAKTLKAVGEWLEGFRCEECSTPNFLSFVIPIKEFQKIKQGASIQSPEARPSRMTKKDFRKRLKELGHSLDEDMLNLAFSAYQEIDQLKQGKMPDATE